MIINFFTFPFSWWIMKSVMYRWLSSQATGLITCTGDSKALSFMSIDCTTEPKLSEKLVEFWSSGQSSWLHNGDVLWFLWGTNWIYICYVEGSRPPLWSSVQSSWLHNGDVLWFLWGTKWIYICYVEKSRPPLWSSGQSSWLQIQRSRSYQIFWEVVGLEQCPLSLVSTIEEQLGRDSSSSGLENREYGRGDPLHWPHDTLHLQKLALTSPTSGSCSVDIGHLQAKAREFSLVLVFLFVYIFILLPCIHKSNSSSYTLIYLS
jgi:hypothetical protein